MKKTADNKASSGNKKYQIPITILAAFVAGALSSLRNITYDSASGQVFLDLNWLKLAIIFVLSWCTVSIHLSGAAREKGYLKRLLCGNLDHTRVYYLDYIRITATILVITNHTVSFAAGQLDHRGALWLSLEMLSFLCLSCNLLFVMVSGALLLGQREESLSVFYVRRVSKVAIPMALYYLSYLVLLNGSSALKPGNWSNILGDILHGSPNVPHFWLIYIILFLYIIAPLLRRVSRQLTDKSVFALTFMFLVFDGFVTYLPFLGVTAGFPITGLTWVTVFMTGYFLRRNVNKHYENILMAGGLLSLAVSLLLIAFSDSYPSLIYNTSPTMVLVSASLFLLIKRIYIKREAISACLACISRYSFSILLIHWYILFYIVKDKLHLQGLSLSIAGGIPLTVAVTLCLSLGFAIVFDNTIVLCAGKAFQKFICCFQRRPQP